MVESIRYLACHNNKSKDGIFDGCTEFEPSQDDPLKCECCDCHRNHHLAFTAEVVQFGVCERVIDGQRDGCQVFLASTVNDRRCACCNCHKNFHCQPSLKQLASSLFNASSQDSHKISLVTGSELVDLTRNEEPEAKRLKVTDDVECEPELPVILEAIKVESPDRLPHQSMKDDSSYDFDDTSYLMSLPPVLKKNWLDVRSHFPFEKSGVYYPRQSKDVKKGRCWTIFREPCHKEINVNKGSLNLANFKTHLTPRAVGGVGKPTFHELALAKLKIEGEQRQKEMDLKTEEDRIKRCAWIKQYAAEGLYLFPFCFFTHVFSRIHFDRPFQALVADSGTIMHFGRIKCRTFR